MAARLRYPGFGVGNAAALKYQANMQNIKGHDRKHLIDNSTFYTNEIFSSSDMAKYFLQIR